MGNGIILQLQSEALDESVDIETLLRKAYLVAYKLNLEDFINWIKSEQNGYSGNVPPYRLVGGEIKAWNPYNGWIPVVLDNNEFEAILCNRKLGDSISKIIELENKSESTFHIQYNAEINKALDSLCDFPIPTQYA